MIIEQIPLSGNDDRGYTAEYLHDRCGQQLMLFRKAGSISGRHYHKGLSETKNPEILLVLNGTVSLNWRPIDKEELQSALVVGPAKIILPLYIWHEIVAETDCVMLEMNSIEEHKVDTFYL